MPEAIQAWAATGLVRPIFARRRAASALVSPSAAGVELLQQARPVEGVELIRRSGCCAEPGTMVAVTVGAADRCVDMVLSPGGDPGGGGSVALEAIRYARLGGCGRGRVSRVPYRQRQSDVHARARACSPAVSSNGRRRSRSKFIAWAAAAPCRLLEGAPRDDALPAREALAAIHLEADLGFVHSSSFIPSAACAVDVLAIVGVIDRDDVGAALGVAAPMRRRLRYGADARSARVSSPRHASTLHSTSYLVTAIVTARAASPGCAGAPARRDGPSDQPH